MRTCWEKKKLLLRAFWEKVLTLKDFETLEGYIVKIETLVTELKITLNFRGVICTFPFLWRRKSPEREREREREKKSL